MIQKIFKNTFLKNALIYGASSGINKGIVLIAMPFLGQILSIAEYGLFGLSETLIIVLGIVVSLNGYMSILREGIGNLEKAHILTMFYLKRVALISLGVILALFFLEKNWIWFTIILILIEALQLILLGFFRSQDNHLTFFLIPLSKLAALFTAYLFVKNDPSLDELLLYFCIFRGLFLLPFLIKVLSIKIKNTLIQNFIPILSFSLFLIPNGLGQWGINYFDRLIIKNLKSEQELGIYTACYSIAMIIAIINSGLLTAITNHVLKNYKKWTQSLYKTKVLVIYSGVIFFISFLFLVLIDFIKTLIDIDILNAITTPEKIIILILNQGMYFLGIQFFYTIILFYHKKAKTTSTITLVTFVFSIICAYYGIITFGIIGAAYATVSSYLLYAAITIYYSLRIDKELKKYLMKDLLIIFLFTLLHSGLYILLI